MQQRSLSDINTAQFNQLIRTSRTANQNIIKATCSENKSLWDDVSGRGSSGNRLCFFFLCGIISHMQGGEERRKKRREEEERGGSAGTDGQRQRVWIKQGRHRTWTAAAAAAADWRSQIKPQQENAQFYRNLENEKQRELWWAPQSSGWGWSTLFLWWFPLFLMVKSCF